MSFAQRERRRKATIAKDQAQKKAHKTGSASESYFLTLAKTPCSCNNPACHRHFRASSKGNPQEIVYRKQPKTILCMACADEQGIKYKISRAWQEARPRRKVKALKA